MKITTEKEFQTALAKLDKMIEGGFEGDAKKEAKFRRLAEAIEAYQIAAGYFDFKTKAPKTISEAINVEMFKRNLTQRQTAKLLGLPDSRLSELLNGKRKLSMPVAKALHRQLNIDSKLILDLA